MGTWNSENSPAGRGSCNIVMASYSLAEVSVSDDFAVSTIQETCFKSSSKRV